MNFRRLLNYMVLPLMPGLIDSHTHLSVWILPWIITSIHTSDAKELTLRAIAMMQKDIIARITTCRCLGDMEFLDIGCRKAVEEKRLSGPRLLVAGKGIRLLAGMVLWDIHSMVQLRSKKQ